MCEVWRRTLNAFGRAWFGQPCGTRMRSMRSASKVGECDSSSSLCYCYAHRSHVGLFRAIKIILQIT